MVPWPIGRSHRLCSDHCFIIRAITPFTVDYAVRFTVLHHRALYFALKLYISCTSTIWRAQALYCNSFLSCQRALYRNSLLSCQRALYYAVSHYIVPYRIISRRIALYRDTEHYIVRKIFFFFCTSHSLLRQVIHLVAPKRVLGAAT